MSPVQYRSEDDNDDSDYHPGGGRRRKAGGTGNRGSRLWRKYVRVFQLNLITVPKPKLATLRVESEKCCRVTSQTLYHNTFDLVATNPGPVTVVTLVFTLHQLQVFTVKEVEGYPKPL